MYCEWFTFVSARKVINKSLPLVPKYAFRLMPATVFVSEGVAMKDQLERYFGQVL